MKRSAVRICLAAPDTENPDTENPYTENPYTENPDTENPYTENPDTDFLNKVDLSAAVFLCQIFIRYPEAKNRKAYTFLFYIFQLTAASFSL